MEQEYTWAQIHGQFDLFMSSFKGLTPMLEMLAQASQVEAYLAGRDEESAKFDAAMEQHRQDMQEAAQEYTDLQAMIDEDKKKHRSRMQGFSEKASKKEQEANDAIEATTKTLTLRLIELDDELAVYYEGFQIEKDELQAELDAKKAQLVETNAALARLKEKL